MLEGKFCETPESVFFKYSLPCSSDLLGLNLISKKDYHSLIDYAKKSIVPSRDFLERLFPNALLRIDGIAKMTMRDRWDSGIIRKYFLEEHNKIIDNEEGLYKGAPKSLKELCKVRVGIVEYIERKDGKLVYTVNYSGKKCKVLGIYLANAKIGDKISTHFRFAIEKLP